jgi:hypothetical protein
MKYWQFDCILDHETMIDDFFHIITPYYLFYHIFNLLSILLTVIMSFNMYIIMIFNWYNWLLTIHISFFVTDDLFHTNSHFWGAEWWTDKMYVCMYSCVSPRVPCITFWHFSVMYSDIKKTNNLLNWISKQIWGLYMITLPLISSGT